LKRLPLYIGGFLGPLGTLAMVPMIPELRDEFGASTSAVSWGITGYLLALALFLLVAGTIGERFGRRRTVRTTYLVYAAASIGCALAPSLGLFVTGRVIQGIANAFITPLLLAALADATSAGRVGRSIGVYGSFQALGGAGAPLLGGLAADVGWRWGFVLVGLMSVALAGFPPAGGPQSERSDLRLRSLASRQPLMLGTAVFIASAGPLGTIVIVGIAARDDLGLSGTATGLVLLGGSAMPILVGPLWGRVIDVLGSLRSAMFAISAACVVAVSLAAGTTPIRLGSIWLIGGVAAAAAVVSIQSTATMLSTKNRGGSISFVLAFRFAGLAVAPVIWIPVFERSVPLAFIGAGLLGLPALALLRRVE